MLEASKRDQRELEGIEGKEIRCWRKAESSTERCRQRGEEEKRRAGGLGKKGRPSQGSLVVMRPRQLRP